MLWRLSVELKDTTKCHTHTQSTSWFYGRYYQVYRIGRIYSFSLNLLYYARFKESIGITIRNGRRGN